MATKQKPHELNETMILLLTLLNGVIIRNGYIGNENWWWLLLITLPLLVWAAAPKFITLKIKNHAKDK